jgi:hypothetical protein
LLLALALILAAFAFAAAMVPFALIVRYRQGTRRRRARSWIVTINLVSIGLSVAIFMVTAAVTNQWVPHALPYSATGVTGGLVLGLLGLALTRWEHDGSFLHYTPSRLLVLAISLVVAGRLAFGLWRGWQAWQTTADGQSWVAAVGVAGSMAAGGMILGYSLMYWAGMRVRMMRERPLHPRRSPPAP